MKQLLIVFAAVLTYHSSPVQSFSIQDVWDNIKNTFLEESTSGEPLIEDIGDASAGKDVTEVGVLWGMADTEALVGHLFKYKIADNALRGSLEQYLYKISEAGGTPLPNWLYFNTTSHTFYGLPTPSDQGIIYIEIKAQTKGLPDSQVFSLPFLIKVRMPKSRNLGPDIEKFAPEDGTSMSQGKSYTCPFDENINHVTLVLDTSMEILDAKKRVKVVYKSALFLGYSVLGISLMPKRNSVVARLLDQQVLVAGPGDADFASTNAGVELSWMVGCGEFKQFEEISKVMEHNIKNGLILKELGFKVIGWHVSQTLPPENVRRNRMKRQIQGTPTPTIQSSPPTKVSDMSTLTSTVDMRSPAVPTTRSSLSLDTQTLLVSSTKAQTPTVTLSTIETSLSSKPPVSPSMTASISSSEDVDSSRVITQVPSTVPGSSDGSISPTSTLSSLQSSASLSSSMSMTSVSTSSPVSSSVVTDTVVESSMTSLPSSSSVEVSPTQDISMTASSLIFTPTLTSMSPEPSTSVIDSSPITSSILLTTTIVSSSVSQSMSSSAQTSSVTESSSVISSATTSLFTETGSTIVSPTIDPSTSFSVQPTSVISTESIAPSPSITPSSSIGTNGSLSTELPTSSISSVTSSPSVSTTASPGPTTPDTPSTVDTSSAGSTTITTESPPATTENPVTTERPPVTTDSTPGDTTVPLQSSESPPRTTETPTTSPPTPTLPDTTSIYTTTPATTDGPLNPVTSPVVDTSVIMTTSFISSSDTISSSSSSSSSSSNSPDTVTMVSSSVPATSSSAPVSLTVTLATSPVSSSSSSSFPELSSGQIIAVETISQPPQSETSTFLQSTPVISSTPLFTSSSVQVPSLPSDSLYSTTSLITPSSTIQPSSTTSIATSSSLTTSSSQSPTISSSSSVTTSSATTSHVTTPPAVTTKVTTESLSPTTDSVTTNIVTTTQLTTQTITTVKPNTAPVHVRQIERINTNVGTYFSFLVPEDTFIDQEDGNTRNLNLTLFYGDGTVITRASWVQFDKLSQTIYGLPLAKDLTDLPEEFFLVAEDSGGLKARDAFQIAIDGSKVADISYEFVLQFTQDFLSFMLATSNYIDVVNKFGAYYGDDTSSLTTITSLRSGSVIMSVTNNTMPQGVCDNVTIKGLYSRVNTSGQLNLDFVRAMAPWAISQTDLVWRGVCVPQIDNTTDVPTAAPVVAGGGVNAGVIVAIILVILIIIAIIILLLCIWWRRKSQKGRYLPEDEKPIFGNNRKPVLLESELELRDKSTRPKRPMVMPADNDPYSYANDGFSPPEDGGERINPPAYIVPRDGGLLPSFDVPDSPASPPDYLPSPAATSSPYDLPPPPEYRLPPPYMFQQGHSDA